MTEVDKHSEFEKLLDDLEDAIGVYANGGFVGEREFGHLVLRSLRLLVVRIGDGS